MGWLVGMSTSYAGMEQEGWVCPELPVMWFCHGVDSRPERMDPAAGKKQRGEMRREKGEREHRKRREGKGGT